MSAAPTRDDLKSHLVAARIAGPVATPRENNLLHYRLFAERDPRFLFGTEPDGQWTPASVLHLMAERCGVNPDPAATRGVDTIDPELTVRALDRFAERIAKAALAKERVLVATGHPNTLETIHRAIARMLRDAGCELVVVGAGWSYDARGGQGLERLTLDYHESVGLMRHENGRGAHTHSPRPLRAVLSVAHRMGMLPSLVVADHGWAGGAGQAGIDAIGFADCNDPALFAAEVEGRVQVSVPLDDGIHPSAGFPEPYGPLIDYLRAGAGL